MDDKDILLVLKIVKKHPRTNIDILHEKIKDDIIWSEFKKVFQYLYENEFIERIDLEKMTGLIKPRGIKKIEELSKSLKEEPFLNKKRVWDLIILLIASILSFLGGLLACPN